ncbi:RNA-directed DNA polymerase, eukaryota, reverse transcriptase zinc-binding domain protein [Tanacetum coccineum]
MHRLSKRKLKIPNLFGDWICSLNTKKHGGDDEGNINKVIERDVSIKEWEMGISSVNELLDSGDGLEASGDMSNDLVFVQNDDNNTVLNDNVKNNEDVNNSEVNMENKNTKENGVDMEIKDNKKTYAHITAKKIMKYENKLFKIPTETDNKGRCGIEPEKLHVWVKMCNVPWEAWIVKGISVVASRIGKPMIMDVVTASMCQEGIGRTGFARVLVEVHAKKDLPDKIDVVYKNNKAEIIRHKSIQVTYSWKPPVCKTCGVFGHNTNKCRVNGGIVEDDKACDDEVVKENTSNNDFIKVVNIKGGNKHNGYKEMNKTTGGNGKFDNKENVDKRMPSNVYKQKHKEKDDETSKQKTDKDEKENGSLEKNLKFVQKDVNSNKSYSELKNVLTTNF